MRRLLALAVGLAGVLAPARSVADTASGSQLDGCLSCHADAAMTATLPSGETVSVHVDREKFTSSVHASLECTDCHGGYDAFPHPARSAKNAAEFKAGFLDGCKSCHLDKYEQAGDGVHEKLRAGGNSAAPSCLDCHGAHDVRKASEPRTRISETCAGCHFDVNEEWAESVHGRALLEKGSQDAPVCTDCHRSHDIPDPTQQAWLVRVHELCGKCHSDPEKMKKYGLSANVVETYLWDFHGTTTQLSAAKDSKGSGEPRPTALCIDCHGVHDIARATDPNSPVLRANLAKTCSKCHEGATENFPAAWLSHYEPTLEKAPLVWLVKVGYMVLIPFMIGGLCLQILLHLWRVVVNR